MQSVAANGKADIFASSGRQRGLSTLPQGLVAEVICVRTAHTARPLHTEEYSSLASPWLEHNPGDQKTVVDLRWIMDGGLYR